LNVDCLTYAADLNNIKVSDHPNYIFSQTDITDVPMISKIFEIYRPEWVINFAAESHVDRSIEEPDRCMATNIIGTRILLDACRTIWKDTRDKVFIQIGTDEVYGEAAPGEQFTEDTPYRPNTPYAASKASANHLARIYHRTYGLPVRTTCCSNNYGPYQHIEKFFPRMMSRMMQGETLTIHGDGSHTRDWLYVEEHCEAIWKVLTEGVDGEVYNVGGYNETSILDTIKLITKYAAEQRLMSQAALDKMIEFVGDRPANDRHYAINSDKIQRELGWSPRTSLEEGFRKTVKHYIEKYGGC